MTETCDIQGCNKYAVVDVIDSKEGLRCPDCPHYDAKHLGWI